MCFNRQHHVLLNSKLGRKLFVLPPRGSPQYLDPGSCLISNSISWGLTLLSMFQLNLLWLLPWAHVRKPFPGEVFFQGLRCNISHSSLEVCFRLPGNVVGSSPWRSCLGAGLGTCAGNRGWARGTQRALPASAMLWFHAGHCRGPFILRAFEAVHLHQLQLLQCAILVLCSPAVLLWCLCSKHGLGQGIHGCQYHLCVNTVVQAAWMWMLVVGCPDLFAGSLAAKLVGAWSSLRGACSAWRWDLPSCWGTWHYSYSASPFFWAQASSDAEHNSPSSFSLHKEWFWNVSAFRDLHGIAWYTYCSDCDFIFGNILLKCSHPHCSFLCSLCPLLCAGISICELCGEPKGWVWLAGKKPSK